MEPSGTGGTELPKAVPRAVRRSSKVSRLVEGFRMFQKKRKILTKCVNEVFFKKGQRVMFKFDTVT